MSALLERTEAPTRTVTLRTLAGVEARRYARHPLFLVGVALLVMFTAIITRDLSQGTGDNSGGVGDGFAPTFLLGLLGVVVGYRLTRSLGRSTDAVQAAPADGVLRTAALCLACLVPGAVALLWVGYALLAMALWPPASSPISAAEQAAILLAGVVCSVGGPLLGVLVGRWTRFPGAGLLTVVLLYVWVGLGLGGLGMSASRTGNLVRLNAPFAGWVSSDSPTHSDPWLAGGSPIWHLVYLILLCGVAATAAMLYEAWGPQRSRLVRTWTILVVLALASLGLAVAADPTRLPL